MYFSPSRKAMFASPIGDDCVEISDDLHNELMADLVEGRILSADENGQPITLPPVVTQLDIEQVYRSKQAMLVDDFELSAANLRGKYPTTETITWPLQLAQAEAYQAWVDGGKEGTPPKLPFLESLNAARDQLNVGAGMEDLVAAIFDNNSKYAPAMALLTAKKQAADRDLIAAYDAGDKAALQAVRWDLTLNVN